MAKQTPPVEGEETKQTPPAKKTVKAVFLRNVDDGGKFFESARRVMKTPREMKDNPNGPAYENMPVYELTEAEAKIYKNDIKIIE